MSTSRKTVIDQMGNEVIFNYPPQRIISLVPSQTELLYDFSLGERVVGITKFCERPASWYDTKTKVGGTKKLRLDIIDSLNPDFIIGNKEENDKESIKALQKKYPVWMSDIVILDDVIQMINELGELTHSLEKSKIITDQITKAFSQIEKRQARVLYLIWRNPWMAAASGTFIHSMIEQMGLANVLAAQSRYPELTSEQIQSLNADHIFLSSEPYPFMEKHIEELKTILPNTNISLVDGQFFSWYGSRLKAAPQYFNSLIV